jgi:Squalene-hopene cyclase C-terminal domain
LTLETSTRIALVSETSRLLVKRGSVERPKGSNVRLGLAPREIRGLGLMPRAFLIGLLLLTGSRASAIEPGPVPAARLRQAIDKSLPLLLKGAEGHAAKRSCFACHNQAIPVLALTTARPRGFVIPKGKLKDQLEAIAEFLDTNQDQYRQGKGQGGQVDTAGYALWTLELGEWEADETTDAVVEYLLLQNKNLDHWRTTSNRPPSEASDFTPTYLALRALAHWGDAAQDQRITKRVQDARHWLMDAKTHNTEDRVFRLWGLKAASASQDWVRKAAEELEKSQRPDGGWAQTDDMTSDAYATGTALVALHEAAKMSTASSAYQRGLRYLLKMQLADGSWHVATRSKPFQTYFESGFPHGKDQFISMAASGWATTALALGCPKGAHDQAAR